MNDTAKKSMMRRMLSATWRGIDGARKVAVNLLFVIIVVALIALVFSGGGPKVEDGVALVIAPQGSLVEQLGGTPMDRAMGELTGQYVPQVLTRDLIRAIDEAKDDDRIKLVVLRLDGLSGGSLTKLQDLRKSIESFKESGKQVIALADNYAQGSYYLAAQADEVLLHPMGMVLIEGYGKFQPYFREGIEKLDVDFHIFKVGTYKSAVEPILRNSMSDEDREASLAWLSDLWDAYRVDVAQAREIESEEIDEYIATLADGLRATDGDAAVLALERGLVDTLANRAEVRQKLIELVGEDDETHSFRQIDHAAYLEAQGEEPAAGGDVVGIVVAKGTIEDGTQPPGKIGGDSTGKLIRDARNDEKVKAVVLRVDSGGGSAFASEVIRRELALTREAGKPVVISMGGVAASGGYWISMASDEIWAHPTTITGSIGIFGMFPTYPRTLARAGIHVDGVGTTPLSGALRPDRELPDEAGQAIQLMVEQGYREFITKVADARGKTAEEVDAIAQGRVWSGADAYDLGLVDQLGDLSQAVESAARLAELGDDFGTRYVEPESSFGERLAANLMGRAAVLFGPSVQANLPTVPFSSELRLLARDVERLSEIDDPRGMYALCMCEVD